MWTIKAGETPRAKVERMAEVKTRLLNLKDEIREIAGLEVSFNSPLAPADNFDVILTSEFNSWSDLEIYKNHPAHIEVAEYIKNVKQERSAIDIEYQ